jgi:hypothetical protein
MRATERRQRHVQPDTTSGLRPHARLFAAAAALALLLFAAPLLTGAFAPLQIANIQAIQAQPLKSPTATDTPTNTPVTTPPHISLVSPSSGKGPVGAHVTVQGSNFSGSSATLFGATQSDCGGQTGSLTTASVSGGTISTTFIWPLSFSPRTYYICAAGMTSSSAAYQVLTSSPPTLSLSASTIQMGQQLIIQGSNFAGLPSGATVALTESTTQPSSGNAITLPVNAVADGNGGFSVTWTVDGPYNGSVTINAYGDTEGSAPAVLQASAVVNIGAAPTATATANASPSAVATASVNTGVTPTNTGGGSSAGLIILLITGIILSLLVILGVVIFLTVRNRGNQGQGQAPGYGDYGGYGGGGTGTAQVPQFGQGMTNGMFPTNGQFAQRGTGRFEATQQYGGQQAGAVSQWDDMDSQPGPDWQPRPMTGHYPDYDTGDASQYGPYTGQYQGQGQGAYPPVDPWDDGSASYGGPGGYPGNTDQWYGGSPQGNPGNMGQPFGGTQGFGGQSGSYGVNRPEELYGGTRGRAATPGNAGNFGNPSQMGGTGRTGATRSVDPRYGGQSQYPRRPGVPGNMPPDDTPGSTAPDWGQNQPPHPGTDQWPDLGGNGGR